MFDICVFTTEAVMNSSTGRQRDFMFHVQLKCLFLLTDELSTVWLLVFVSCSSFPLLHLIFVVWIWTDSVEEPQGPEERGQSVWCGHIIISLSRRTQQEGGRRSVLWFTGRVCQKAAVHLFMAISVVWDVSNISVMTIETRQFNLMSLKL